ncbi:site-specific integrase [Pusillimonas sp.]|uniref:site-specific integrase n=1 Tax=Pusillimonas sp. TaxID=3040095 RepID=UPI0037CB0827
MATVSSYRGKWKCQVRKKGYPPQTKTFQLKADAEAWGRSIEVQMDRGTFMPGSVAEVKRTIETVKDLLEEYVKKESVKKADGGYADRNRIKPLVKELGAYSIHNLKSPRLKQYKDDRLALGFAPQTVTHELNILHRAYVVAVEEWGVNLRAPIPRAKRPMSPVERDYRITPESVQAIRDNTESPLLGDIVEFAIETCMRRGEIVRLDWDHVNLKNRTVLIPVTKNGKKRTIPLSKKARDILMRQEGRSGSVFGMSQYSISQAFKRAVDRCELGHLVFHDTRHEGISRLFERGLNVIEVARISGHRTLSQLDRYTHLDVKHLAKRIG